MPGRIHTRLPEGRGHRGERDFVERILDLCDDSTHVWAGVDYLPGGVPDLDVIVVREDIGAFNIEVKAVSLDMIEEFGLDHCRISGRSDSRHPVKQAATAQLGLRNYIGSLASTRCPFFFATAALSRIRREDMAARFDSDPLRRQYDGMLFLDDLDSAALLEARLRAICQSPPRGRPPRDPVPRPEQVQLLVKCLDQGARPPATPGDRARGDLLARQVGLPGRPGSAAGVTERYLSPGQREPVLFRGAPGTGKTVRLQEIAVAHARAGRAVLFTCFNKVLASTLRGIQPTQRLGEEVDRRIVLAHVDEMRHQLDERDLETFRGLFGTVCVDEAQDLPQEYFEFLQVLATPAAEWFLADGPGQELYNHGSSSAWLDAARERGVVQNLRRNYRNSTPGFLVAQAVYEHGPDVAAIEEWVARRGLPGARPREAETQTLDLEFDRDAATSELPAVVRLGVPRGSGWRQAKLDGYTAVLQQELERAAASGHARDVMVLCARTDSRSAEPQLAREALQRLGVPVHDQISTMARGQSVPEGHVRLTTIHSARGVEAARVVILDMDGGISPAPDHLHNSRIMSYIAMSRAQFGTTIVTLEDAENPFVRFVEQLVAAYRRTLAAE